MILYMHEESNSITFFTESWVKADPEVLYMLQSFPFFEQWRRNWEEDCDTEKQSSSKRYHEQHSSLPWAWLHTSNLALREYKVGCITVLYYIQWYQTTLKGNVWKYKAKKVWLKYISKARRLPAAACKPQGGRVGEDNTGTAKSITT